MNNNVKKMAVVAMFAALFGGYVAGATAPISIDVANNNVNVPGAMVSDQIYRDHYQLAIKPDIISMLTNGGCWTTNNIFSWNSAGGAKDGLWLDGGRVVVVAPNEWIYVSDNDGMTWRASYDMTVLGTFGYPSLGTDAAGYLYFLCTTGTPYASSCAAVFRSSDKGISWTPVMGGNTNVATRYPTLATSERGDVFVGASTRGDVSNQYYAVSHDRGDTWTYVYPTWQAKLYASEVNSKWSTYAGNGHFVFASSYADKSGWEIMTSSDYGTTWSVNSNYVTSGDLGFPNLAAGSQGRVMLMGSTSKKVYLSKDYGATWSYIGTKAALLYGAVNLYGSKWVVNENNQKLYYTPDDFVTLVDLGITPAAGGGLNNELGLRVCKKAIYTLGNYTSKTNQDLLALRAAPLEGINPLAVPVLSTAPAAYPGGFYTDGVTYYRCTNGTTWTEF